MTLSANLLLAFLILAPGLGVFAGARLGGFRKPFRPAPPAPGSLMALTLVTIGALAIHAAAACFLLLASAGHDAGLIWAIPNPYGVLISMRSGSPSVVDRDVAYVLSSFFIFALVGCAVGRGASLIAFRLRSVRALIYGWADELLESLPVKGGFVNVFVVSDVESDGGYLGYEGTLSDLRIDQDGQVKSLMLRDAERFILQVNSSYALRLPVERSPLPFLLIESENIKNVTFDIYADLTDVTVEDVRDLTDKELDLLASLLDSAGRKPA